MCDEKEVFPPEEDEQEVASWEYIRLLGLVKNARHQ